VNSAKATQFRIWATSQLKELVVKGFVMDDERLKNGKYFGKDYFQELLERVRSIRTSERRIWQQITDIFAECSKDYHDKSTESEKIKQDFFASVQNKFHYAIADHTAAEIVYHNANHSQPKMGLKTWKNSPKGRILKSDVVIAKNYLEEVKILELERLVGSFFDYIENQIQRRNDFTMADFAKSIDKFLDFNDYKILYGAGKISHKQAESKAGKEYDIFNKNQKIESDFDKLVKKTIKQSKEK
jgi:hypothetical protein